MNAPIFGKTTPRAIVGAGATAGIAVDAVAAAAGVWGAWVITAGGRVAVPGFALLAGVAAARGVAAFAFCCCSVVIFCSSALMRCS